MDDKEIVKQLLHELRITSHALSKKVGYKSPASVDHILKGISKISEGFTDRVIKEFPQVNYWFLKKGQLPVIIENEKLQKNQSNLFANFETASIQKNYDLEILVSVKNQEAILKNIEQLLITFVEIKKTDN